MVALTVAPLALMAPAVLPHLHLWQNRAHQDVELGAPMLSPKAQAYAAGDEAPSPEHAESRCPACQAIAHAPDFLPEAVALAAAGAGTLGRAWIAPARRAHARAAAHGSHGPPLAA